MKSIYISIIISLLSYSVVSYLNGFLAYNVTNPDRFDSELPDYLFKLLPLIPQFVPNTLLVTYIIYFLLRNTHIVDLNNLLKLINIITILFLLRAVTFTVTIVPPSLPGCVGRNLSMPIEWDIMKFLLTSDDNTCTDYMYSGHAVYFTLMYKYMYKFNSNIYERMLNTIYVAIGLTSIIAAHIHYSVDVIIGIAMSTIMFDLLMF